MKFFFLSACLALTLTSCSKVEVADDPILGIWAHQLQTTKKAEGIEIDAQEWIFNDVYKGRFHGYKDGELVYNMDYQWSVDDGQYLLIYNGGDLSEISFIRSENELMNLQGELIASKVKSN